VGGYRPVRCGLASCEAGNASFWIPEIRVSVGGEETLAPRQPSGHNAFLGHCFRWGPEILTASSVRLDGSHGESAPLNLVLFAGLLLFVSRFPGLLGGFNRRLRSIGQGEECARPPEAWR
jgi:hypothetical protein